MSITRGTKLGPYEVVSPLGAGGMGEVYRARDTRLDRTVAIKVLSDTFTQDPERMARFEREARVLASLNHPNIASIYGSEDSANLRALVLELVPGPTLADRIKRGAIPVDDALRIAGQIAEALEYAHNRGIVHRDLKPANIGSTDGDAVKVLDFGLAKAIAEENVSVDISASPSTPSIVSAHQGCCPSLLLYITLAKQSPCDRDVNSATPKCSGSETIHLRTHCRFGIGVYAHDLTKLEEVQYSNVAIFMGVDREQPSCGACRVVGLDTNGDKFTLASR